MAKQEPLPEILPVAIAELTELAEKYEAKRDARIKLLAQEIDLKDQLLAMMDSYKLETYRDGDLIVYKTNKVNLKCRRENDEEKED